MINSQPAIVADVGHFGLYVLFNVTGSPRAVSEKFAGVHALVDEINANQPESHLKASIAFSRSFCDKINLVTPADFVAFTPLGHGDIHAPATQCDILLHVNSSRHDLNFFLLRKFMTGVASEVNIIDETYGYRFLDSRDMTGFIDGTENPQGEHDRQQVSIIADGECAGGSMVMVQRYVHRLEAWEETSVAQQEKVFGRTKADSIELEDVPIKSHVGRVDLKENGKGLKVVRHSLPYGSVSGEHGLLFIAYSHSPSVFKTLLGSMYGDRDGKTDQLLRFTQAKTGAYFFAPSMATLLAMTQQ